LFGKSFRLGRVIGIPININFSWFIVFILVTWTLSVGYFPHYYPEIAGYQYWIMGIIAATLLFLSVLIHELMHAQIARMSGMKIRSITLFIFGGVAQISEEPPTPKVEFKMAIAGPLGSILIAIIFGSLAYLINGIDILLPVYAVARYISVINLILAAFNLIPGFPLDGGRVLRSFIWHKTGNLKRATRISSNIGKGFAMILVFLGFTDMIISGLFVRGLWFMFIGFFLYRAAESSYEQVTMRKALSGVKVYDVMKSDVVSVNESLSIKDLVEDYFFKYRYTSFPVVQADRLIGLVSFEKVKGLDKNRWEDARVTDIMDRDIENFSVTPFHDAGYVLERFARGGIERLAVVTEGDKLTGIVTQNDILRLLHMKADLGR